MQQPIQQFSAAFTSYFNDARLSRMYYDCVKYYTLAESAEKVRLQFCEEDDYDYYEYNVDDGRSPFYKCFIRDVLEKELVDHDKLDIQNYYHHGFTIFRFIKKYNKGMIYARRYIYDMLVNLSEINFPTTDILDVCSNEINFSWWLAEMVSTTNRHETNLVSFGFFGDHWDSDIIMNLDKYHLNDASDSNFIFIAEGDAFAFIGFTTGLVFDVLWVISNVTCHFEGGDSARAFRKRFVHVHAQRQDIEKSEYGSLNILVEGLTNAKISESRVIGFGDAEVKVAFDESRLSWIFTLE